MSFYKGTQLSAVAGLSILNCGTGGKEVLNPLG